MKRVVLGVLCFFVGYSLSYGEDPYQRLADELTRYAEGIKRIAVMPFSYAENIQMKKDGSVIAERLSVKLINLKRFEVIERSQLDKVLQELKLQNTGLIDPTTTKELGRILGVDAIITGTLVPTADGKIEVNAKIIKTDTAQAIGASQVYVVKDWVGGEELKQGTILRPSQTSPSQGGSGFFEVIGGFGPQWMTLTADRNTPLPFPGLNSTWREIKDAKAEGFGPIGIRMGGFGNSIVGGDFEFSISRYKTSEQYIKWDNGQVLTMPEGFIAVTSFGLSGDLLFRTLTKTQLYFGFGLGLSIAKVTSTHLRNYDDSSYVDEFSLGFLWRIPVGIRFNMDNTTFFLEWRYQGEWTTFDRGNYGNESHEISVSSSRFCLGIGSRF